MPRKSYAFPLPFHSSSLSRPAIELLERVLSGTIRRYMQMPARRRPRRDLKGLPAIYVQARPGLLVRHRFLILKSLASAAADKRAFRALQTCRHFSSRSGVICYAVLCFTVLCCVVPNSGKGRKRHDRRRASSIFLSLIHI